LDYFVLNYDKLYKTLYEIMLMDINKVISTVESSEQFKDIDPGHYLVHIFMMMEAKSGDECQVGYYLKSSDKITVFDYNDSKISIIPPQDALKEDQKHIPALDMSKVKIGMGAALAKSDETVKNNYPTQLLMKAIVLLQNLPPYGQIWNITVITHTFNVINIKIDAESGKLLHQNMESLLQWKKE
jgi:hypothetical protein